MTSNRPATTGKSAPPPTSRRSARQRRLASREANRALARAGSTGGSGGGMRTLMMWTGVALIVGIVIVGGAYVLTKPADVANLPSPMAPAVVTPANIPTNGRTLGNPDAKVTIDVYEDFRCTGCFAFRTEIEPAVETGYIATGKAKLVFHDFITIDTYNNSTESRDAANAALCAADQNKFWTMHDWLFANQSPRELPGYFTIDRLVEIGRLAGMNMSTFEPCVRQGTHNAEVTAEQSAAPSGVTSTPSIFVNGTIVTNTDNSGSIPTADQIGAAVDGILNPSPSPSASGSGAASASPVPSASAS